MPLREEGLPRFDIDGEKELREALQAEFAHPKDRGEPEIIVAHPSLGTIHLYVIWSRWNNVDQLIRSRIILDAFSAVRGEDQSLQVTVSMGLTPSEADRLGIRKTA